jgi:hypothetical protein
MSNNRLLQLLKKSNKVITINEKNKAFDPLYYVLSHPHADYGYRPHLNQTKTYKNDNKTIRLLFVQTNG